MRANRKGKPQHKMIFAISAMFTTSAMFAQCKEGFPLGGKKTASSLSRKRLMRGDKSPLTQGIHSPYAPHSPIKREAALFTAPHLPINPKTSLYGNRRPKNERSFHTPTRRLPCREVRGDEGGLEGEETPPKGVSSPSKVFLTPSPPPPLPWQGVRVLRGWKGFSDAEHRGKARRRPS